MHTSRYTTIRLLLSQILIIATIFVVDASSTADKEASLALSGTRSSSRDVFTSTRHKRAPGWGKRAPGWGKRSDEYIDEADVDSEDEIFADELTGHYLEEVPIYGKKRAPGWGKRAPGWGKRAPGWGKRAPGWGKRAPGWGKRAPGWGKRSMESDLNNENFEGVSNVNELDLNEEIFREKSDYFKELLGRVATLSEASRLPEDAVFLDRRAPGWGKRNSPVDVNYEESETDKRAPGWGKRAPGWGKRAPGLGKRNYFIELDDEVGKRAPGWGKREHVLNKKVAGWGKRSVPDNYQELQNLSNDFSTKTFIDKE